MINRRIIIDGKRTGGPVKRPTGLFGVKRRVTLSYDGWRIRHPDGRVSAQAFLKRAAESIVQIIHKEHGLAVEIVPAWEETIDPVEGFTVFIYIDGPEVARTVEVRFGNPRVSE